MKAALAKSNVHDPSPTAWMRILKGIKRVRDEGYCPFYIGMTRPYESPRLSDDVTPRKISDLSDLVQPHECPHLSDPIRPHGSPHLSDPVRPHQSPDLSDFVTLLNHPICLTL